MARHEIRRVTIAAEKRLPFEPLILRVIDEVFLSSPRNRPCESFDFAPLGLRSGRTGGDDRPFPNLNKGGFHRKASVLVKCLQSQYEKGSPVSINAGPQAADVKRE